MKTPNVFCVMTILLLATPLSAQTNVDKLVEALDFQGQGALGSHRRHVGGAGSQFAERRVVGAASALCQTLFPKQAQRRGQNRLE